MKIVVIDNYDSFTYNLVEYFHKLGVKELPVFRNDKVSVESLEEYDKIVLSPGPGIPSEAGALLEIIQRYGKQKDILGICLGHQAIAEVYGGRIINGKEVYHGISTSARRTAVNRGCLRDFPEKFQIGRYHSWYVCEEMLPDCFEVTCYDTDGIIMGIIHKKYNIEGIQFHPESVLTPLGLGMLKNWIEK